MVKISMSSIPTERITEILNAPIAYTDDKEAKKTQELMKTLSVHEIEMAAQGSYAFWLARVSDYPLTEQQIWHMASKEVQRHLFNVSLEDATKALQCTCQYRKEYRIDLIRASFTQHVTFDTFDDENRILQIREQIHDDLMKQACYVRGYDKQNRAIYIIQSRLDKGTIDDEFIITQLYMMERAIATTEYISSGHEAKIIVILDFGAFKSSLSPSLSAVQKVVHILQTKYPERLKNLIVNDPPIWMRAVYNIIKPFLDPMTKAKFIVVSGNKQKQQVLSTIIDPQQAMTFMMPNGQLTEPVDLLYFLQVVPFHCCYDDNVERE